MAENTQENKTENAESKVERKPNDTAGFHFSSSIKITNPDSGEVLLHARAD